MKTKVKGKQRRGATVDQVTKFMRPLKPNLTREEAAAILATRGEHSALQVVHAMAALGHCTLYGSLHDPLIRLAPAIRDLQPEVEQAGS